MNRIALRIDDIGASSKHFELYSKKLKGFGNFLFLKKLPSLAAWGPYEEMSPKDWEETFSILEKYKAKLTVGITASWVNFDGSLTPFPEKFPEQAALLKQAQIKGLVEIANHGLTHCVLKNHLFRPKLFKGNRQFHREFWPWLEREIHFKHLKESQKILNEYFNLSVKTLIPPGNVYSNDTLDAACELGIQVVNCQTKPMNYKNLKILSNDNVIPFHDKELVQFGTKWLEETIKKNPSEWVFVSELT